MCMYRMRMFGPTKYLFFKPLKDEVFPCKGNHVNMSFIFS